MMAQGLWWGAAGAVLLAIISAVADWRRTKRRSLDKVGWVPWPLLQILALFTAAICVILALRS